MQDLFNVTEFDVGLMQHGEINVPITAHSLSITCLGSFASCSGSMSRAVALHPPRCRGPFLFLYCFSKPCDIFYEKKATLKVVPESQQTPLNIVLDWVWFPNERLRGKYYFCSTRFGLDCCYGLGGPAHPKLDIATTPLFLRGFRS